MPQKIFLFYLCLSELSGFFDSQTFDYLIIGGDLNVDFTSGSKRCSHLRDFMNEFNLICVNCSSLSITHTYERDDGRATS